MKPSRYLWFGATAAGVLESCQRLVLGVRRQVVVAEPIGHEDDTLMQKTLAPASRKRVVPLGLLRLNLGQEAMAMALTTSPEGLFPEPVALADTLTTKFRRFVSLMEI